MRKTKRLFLIMGLMTFGFGVFTGCGKVTPESLAKDVVKNTADVKSLDADMQVDFAGKVSLEELGEGVSMDMTMGMDLNMKMTEEPDYGAYINGKINLSMFSMNMDLDMESYSVKEDDSYVTYTLTEGQWTKVTTDEPEEAVGNVSQSDLFEMIANGDITAELEEELAEVNDKEAYLMHTTVSGEALKAVMSLSEQLMGDKEGSGPDYESMETNADIYIYKDTKQLARVTMDCKNLGVALFGEAGMEDALEVETFDVSIQINSYDSVEPIKVPDEALKSAVEVTDEEGALGDLFGDSEEGILGGEENSLGEGDGTGEDEVVSDEAIQNADGSYTIVGYDKVRTATIAVPDDFWYAYSTANYLSISSEQEQYSTTIVYTFDEFSTMDEMAAYYGDVSYLEGDDDYTEIVSSGEQVTSVGSMEVHYIGISYTYIDEYQCLTCYAWTEMADGIPFIAQIDYFGYGEPQELNAENMVQSAYAGVTLSTGNEL